MSYASSQNAICFNDIKTAAIYFDSVIPVGFKSVSFGPGHENATFELPEEIPGNVLIDLVFNDNPTSKSEKWARFTQYLYAWESFDNAIQTARSSKGDGYASAGRYEDVRQYYLEDAPCGSTSTVRQEFRKFSQSLGSTYSTVLLPASEESAESNPCTALMLSGIPLIDTSKASWEQILELRKDTAARNKLRDLRLFLHKNYSGQSTAFISDDICHRVEEYTTARKRLGFDATVGSISALLDAKSLQAAAATGITAALMGGPLSGIGSAVLIEIGSMALELTKRRFAIKEFENGHDLAYLIHAKKTLT